MHLKQTPTNQQTVDVQSLATCYHFHSWKILVWKVVDVEEDLLKRRLLDQDVKYLS